jgi:hypothetical protein
MSLCAFLSVSDGWRVRELESLKAQYDRLPAEES